MITARNNGLIRRITLDRPDKRNALTPDALDRLADEASQYDNTRVLLIMGRGKAFCAGFDLDLCRDDDDSQPTMRRFLTGLAAAIAAIRAQHRAVVLCAHGAAVAGGCALLGAADVVVADAAAKIGYPVTRLGISPAISAPYARQGLGDGATRARLLDSGLISGADAYRLGLVHELTDDATSAIDRAQAIAEALAAKPPHAISATRRWLDDVSPVAMAEEALDTSLALTTSPDAIGRLRNLWKSA